MDVHGVFGHVQTFKAALERQLVSCPPEDRLALLLEATADVEREMLSTLRSSLIDLYEALSWKYASEAVRPSMESRLCLSAIECA